MFGGFCFAGAGFAGNDERLRLPESPHVTIGLVGDGEHVRRKSAQGSTTIRRYSLMRGGMGRERKGIRRKRAHGLTAIRRYGLMKGGREREGENKVGKEEIG